MNTRLLIKRIRGKGRGIIAGKRFLEGDLIEICPVILFKAPLGSSHVAEYYCFRWDKNNVAIALGLGSIYNHSYSPNARYVQNKKDLTIEVYAYKDIRKGEEICFNYNGNPESTEPLWFKVR